MKRKILIPSLTLTLLSTPIAFTSCGGDSQSSTLDSITVAEPIATTYVVGDKLDLTGLTVTANFKDGTSKTLSSSEYTTSPANGATLTANDTKVTVTYLNKTTSFAISVQQPATQDEYLTKHGEFYNTFNTSTKGYNNDDIKNNIISGVYETSYPLSYEMNSITYGYGICQAGYGDVGQKWNIQIGNDKAAMKSWFDSQIAAGSTIKYIVSTDKIAYQITYADGRKGYSEHNSQGYLTFLGMLNTDDSWYYTSNTFTANPTHDR